MQSKKPRLRGKRRSRSSPHDIGEFNDSTIVSIGRSIVHRLAVGHADITGDDFAGIFAKAIDGEHMTKPLGVADVIWEGCAWSAKTINSAKPFEQKNVRLISGRNSPDYSYGITDPRKDIQATGNVVLRIWNARIDQSFAEYEDLRIVVFLRNMNKLQFTIFEYEATRYQPQNYRWHVNKKGNLQGHSLDTGEHCFTWQFHGSQFTVIKPVPKSAYKFRITRRPALLEEDHVIRQTRFNDKWVQKVT